MFIPFEVLLGFSIFIVVLVFLVRSNIRRSIREHLYQIAFWKYAYITTSDEAYKQFDCMEGDIEWLIENGVLKPEDIPSGLLGSRRIAELCENPTSIENSKSGQSAQEKYNEHVDYIFKLCKDNGYAWVSVEDKSYLFLDALKK